jgi:hypothetical protein
VGTCTAPRSRLRRSLAYPWPRGRRCVPLWSYARRFRLRPAVAGLRRDAGAARGTCPRSASSVPSYPAGTAPAKLSRSLLKTRSPVPAWSVMPYPHPPRQRSCHGGCYPAPLRSTPSASSRETRRHFVPSRSLLGRSRRSAPLRGRWCHRSGPRTALRCVVPACKRSPQSLRACHAACEKKSTRHAKPSAPRLRARLDAGLGKVRRWAAPLVLARWPRAALPPSAGGRSAGILAERFGCSAADRS